eukprot:15457486-Alexandrium_andersonii.AAC.1
MRGALSAGCTRLCERKCRALHVRAQGRIAVCMPKDCTDAGTPPLLPHTHRHPPPPRSHPGERATPPRGAKAPSAQTAGPPRQGRGP